MGVAFELMTFRLLLVTAAACGLGFSQERPPAGATAAIRTAVREYIRGGRIPDDLSTSYFVAFARLNPESGLQALVHLQCNGWCGSGGCTTLILTPEGSSYRVIGLIPASRLPIRMLKTSSHGWRDLSFWSWGGGDPGSEQPVRFDGESYAKTLEDGNGNRKGRVVLSDKHREAPLFP